MATPHSISRVYPKIMQAQIQPQPEAGAEKEISGTSQDGKGEKVLSRVENTHEGFCPICDTQMSATEANGNPVLYCAAHNIVMPLRDQGKF